MDNKLITGAAFIGLRKAFDTVDHTRLFTKLRRFGFSASVIDWFTSYLSSRTTVTSINNITYSPKPVHGRASEKYPRTTTLSYI